MLHCDSSNMQHVLRIKFQLLTHWFFYPKNCAFSNPLVVCFSWSTRVNMFFGLERVTWSFDQKNHLHYMITLLMAMMTMMIHLLTKMQIAPSINFMIGEYVLLIFTWKFQAFTCWAFVHHNCSIENTVGNPKGEVFLFKFLHPLSVFRPMHIRNTWFNYNESDYSWRGAEWKEL